MFKNFTEIETYLQENHIRAGLALGGCHDDLALPAVVRAKKKGFIAPILVGDGEKTRALLTELGEDPNEYEIINETREMRMASKTVGLVRDGRADLTMKGLMQSSTYLMAIQDPFGGLVEEDVLLNQVTAFHLADQDRLVLCGDCAFNTFPTLEEKKKILGNMLTLAGSMGVEKPKVALLSALEKPSSEIPSSVEAAEIASMDWGDALVEGPMALDNILDAGAAAHKGMDSQVAGKADIILVPDIHAGNVLHKSIHFFGHLPFGTLLIGDGFGAVFNSRTDDEDAKYYSILLGVLNVHGRAAK